MMKKYIILFLVFFSFFLKSYAFDAQITIDNDSIDINDNIKITLIVDMQDSSSVQIKRFDWLENFEVLYQSSSQSSSYKTQMINWKTKTVSNQINYVEYTLKAKKQWDFILWPIVISDWIKDISTNTIKINVNWEKTSQIKNKYKKEYISKKYNEKEDYFYFTFIVIILISWLIAIYIYREKINNFIYSFKQNYKNEELWIQKVNNNLDIYKNESFLNLPDIEDKDFIIKIENYIKQKIISKYNLDIKNIDLNELVKYLDDGLSDKVLLSELIESINKYKYSNLLISKQFILDIAKKI